MNGRMGKRQVVGREGPDPNAIVYRGRIKAASNLHDTDVLSMGFDSRAQVVTDGSGNGSTSLVFSNADVAGLSDHTAMGTLYEEYRVLGIRVEYHPKLQYADGSAAGGGTGNEVVDPTVLAPFRENTGPLTSLYTAMNYGRAVIKSVNVPCALEVRMDETELAEWLDVGDSPAADQLFGIKTWQAIGGGPATTTVQEGTFLAYYCVQYRTRRTTNSAPGLAASAVVQEEKKQLAQSEVATGLAPSRLPVLSLQVRDSAVPHLAPPLLQRQNAYFKQPPL